MAAFPRPKRVTVPLDDTAKARLIGTGHLHRSSVTSTTTASSSGSEHSAHHSPSLSDLVHEFLHHRPDDHHDDPDADEDSDSDSDPPESARDSADYIREILLAAANATNADPYRKLLVSHLSVAAQRLSRLRLDKSALRRHLMALLRELGHNAAVCKTKWSASGNMSSGHHEFVDVVRSGPSGGHGHGQGQIRYFVEFDLASEFQIARPTVQYSRMLQCLPRIFVGTGEELRRIVRLLCDGARKSLRSRDLSVSPWRKNQYVQNKWFGPYRRTMNPIPEKSPPTVPPQDLAGAAYRCVGFDGVVSDVNSNRHFFVRTRG